MNSGDFFSQPDPFGSPAGQWSVQFEASFEVDRIKVSADARRFDELCEAVTWLMENKPDSDDDCPQVPGTPFRLARAIDPDGGLIRVLFTTNAAGRQVRAWRVDRIQPATDDAEDDF